jgi:hypothetical protein
MNADKRGYENTKGEMREWRVIASLSIIEFEDKLKTYLRLSAFI